MENKTLCDFVNERIENFTPGAVEALINAEKVCIELGDTAVTTGHILWGLSVTESGSAAALLVKHGVMPDRIYTALKYASGKSGKAQESEGPEGAADETVPEYTYGALRALNDCYDLAVVRGTSDGTRAVGTLHLLFSLFVQDSFALHTIGRIGINDKELFGELGDYLNSNEIMRRKLVYNLGGQELPDELRDAETDAAIRELKARQEMMRREGSEQEGMPVTPGMERRQFSGALEYFGRDMVKAAREGAYMPVIGRAQEMQRLIRILFRKSKNNPCLIGEAGVGKTAVVEGLATLIAEGKAPDYAAAFRIINIDMTAVLAGARYRGDFEERVRQIVDEAAEDPNIILFIDEIHNIVGSGGAEGGGDAASLLKPALSQGRIRLIGATTPQEYRRHFERDAAFSRRFQPVKVEEPTEAETLAIIEGLAPVYEKFHGVSYEKTALRAAVTLSKRFISDRFLPDKAVDVIDEAAAAVRTDSGSDSPAGEVRTVRTADVESVVARISGVPVEKVGRSDSERLLGLEATLHKRVVGQTEAVEAVSKAVRRGRTGMKDPKRPIGSFLFLGPTGVGKTELARALAESLFGSESNLIRLDMSEYMEAHSVSKMVGSPPGYVGYDEGGQLTERIRLQPYSVILFDEIEKAHPDVFNILLQVLEDGMLTDSKGRSADFKNAVIIMTSNIGARDITDRRHLGFSDDTDENRYTQISDAVRTELKKVFKPEFLNRVDETVIFRPLTHEQIKDIARIQLKLVEKRCLDGGFRLDAAPEVVEYLAAKGYDPKFGARPLKRLMQKEIDDQLSEEILRFGLGAGASAANTAADVHTIKGTIRLEADETGIHVSIIPSEEGR